MNGHIKGHGSSQLMCNGYLFDTTLFWSLPKPPHLGTSKSNCKWVDSMICFIVSSCLVSDLRFLSRKLLLIYKLKSFNITKQIVKRLMVISNISFIEEFYQTLNVHVKKNTLDSSIVTNNNKLKSKKVQNSVNLNYN